MISFNLCSFTCFWENEVVVGEGGNEKENVRLAPRRIWFPFHLRILFEFISNLFLCVIIQSSYRP